VPSVSKAQVMALTEATEWLDRGANVLLFGPPGVGKTHLIAGIGHALIDAGRRVLFTRCSELVQRLQEGAHRARHGALGAHDAGAARAAAGLEAGAAADADADAVRLEGAAGHDSPPGAHERIRVVRAAEGARVRMIPLTEIVAFEAADKYVQVLTEQGGDALIRMSLRELALRLEGVEFTQVHRGVLVNAARIVGAERDEAGHYWLTLRGLKRPLKVSRAFSHLFKPM